MNWKKTGAAVLLLAAAWGLGRLPHPAVDVGKLEPVELVLIEGTETGIHLKTETGARGTGGNLAEAVEDLRKGASAEVFLESADKILIRGDVERYWPEIWALLRPDCLVCEVKTEIDLASAAEYLSVHPSGQTLGRLLGGLGGMPVLYMKEGRFGFEE